MLLSWSSVKMLRGRGCFRRRPFRFFRVRLLPGLSAVLNEPGDLCWRGEEQPVVRVLYMVALMGMQAVQALTSKHRLVLQCHQVQHSCVQTSAPVVEAHKAGSRCHKCLQLEP